MHVHLPNPRARPGASRKPNLCTGWQKERQPLTLAFPILDGNPELYNEEPEPVHTLTALTPHGICLF